jgi:multisubunit Na+/H+ antiporter MnhB subunit
MKIDTGLVQPVAAVVSAVLLMLAGRKRIFEVIALIASGVWLAITIDIFKWPLTSLKPGLVIGGALLVSGVAVYLKTSNKREVTASTVLAILGGILVFGALGRLG